ncbi:OmpH family outer membrane protein [Thermodesulfobacteriota bacterium]
MKYLSGIIFLLFAVIISQANVLAEESSKIGVLDLRRCIQESNEGKRVYDALKKKHETLQADLDKKQQELLEMQQDIEKQSLMLSMDAKENRQKEFEKKKRDLTYIAQDMQEEMKRAESDANIELLKVIHEVVAMVAKKKGLELITERSGVIYVAEGIDISGEVIIEINKLKP